MDYFADEENKERLERLLSYLTIEKPQASQEEQKLAGLTFVITGSVEHFPNRNALKARIEELGGKATGSVTGKTSYLINNDTTSSSSKKPESARTRRAGDLRRGISEDDRRITKYLQRRFASRAGICYNRKQTAEIPCRKKQTACLRREKRGRSRRIETRKKNMPVKVQADLPVKEILESENIFVMDETRAVHQDIRPLKIMILNLMPLKEDTELQLLRSLSNTSLQVDVTFLMVASHEAKIHRPAI